MGFKLVQSGNSQFICTVILCIIAFYVFVFPYLEKKEKEVKEKFENILNGLYKVDTAMCSSDCCGTQWPVSFDTVRDPRIKEGEVSKEGEDGTKYKTSNFTCSGLHGRGCVCLSNEQHEMLASRGGNAI
jgi:hypothetical protein